MLLKRIGRSLNRIIEQPLVLLGKFKRINSNHSFTCLTVRDLIGEVKTLIDVGANEGSFVKAAKYVFPNAKIYAFEPQSKFYNVLKKIENISIFNFGLWDKDSEDFFYINKENSGASSFLKPLKDYTKYIGSKDKILKTKVVRKRFDKLNLLIKRPCFVKIDVEGGEEKVLNGFGDKLNEVDTLQIEWFFRDFHKNQMRLGKVIPFLEKYGFVGFIQRELGYLDNYPSACDLIFFKKKLIIPNKI